MVSSAEDVYLNYKYNNFEQVEQQTVDCRIIWLWKHLDLDSRSDKSQTDTQTDKVLDLA